MQTFLSELTFADSAAALDSVRLNKQLLEGRQILHAISITPDGGGSRVDGKVPFASNHPVTNQWRGHEFRLAEYLLEVRRECDKRGIQTKKNWEAISDLMAFIAPEGMDLPAWWTNYDERAMVIRSHRYNLYNKDKVYYGQYEGDAEKFARDLADTPHDVVCCTTHAPYWYPTHRS
jgi:hypothetical protein